MDPEAAKEKRPVLVETLHGTVEGWLLVNTRVRTTDYLNMACRQFVPVGATATPFPGWSCDRGELGISTASVLFLAELADTLPMTDSRIEANRFTRTLVKLRVGTFDIQGFMHVPSLSDPITRLAQNKAAFVALTSVSIVGPSSELAASYLALNPDHILMVQTMTPDEPVSVVDQVLAGTGADV